MGKHSFREWMIAVRPWSFPASAMPVLVTLGCLFARHEDINWVNGVWALLNIVIFHAAGNTWSDYFDYRRHVDAQDTFGVKTLTSGMFTPKEIYRLSLTLLLVALLAGIGLWLRTGMPLLYIGFAGLLCAVTTDNAKCYPGDNPYLLPRVRMLGSQTLDEFISAIQ